MDLIEAYAWASSCARLGELGAKIAVDTIARNLSAFDMERAVQQAEKYRRKYFAVAGH